MWIHVTFGDEFVCTLFAWFVYSVVGPLACSSSMKKGGFGHITSLSSGTGYPKGGEGCILLAQIGNLPFNDKR